MGDMSKKYKAAIIILVLLGVVLSLAAYFHKHPVAVLDPVGQVGQKERNLIIFAVLLSVLVVVPVYVMTIVIALRYRESNHHKKTVAYTPDWDHSRVLETIWWGIPLLIIGVLSVVTWNSSHDLDPFKPLNSTAQPLNVQVVALDWKWLFIYPQQHIASVNFMQFPVNTPVNFTITSDTVMNSFWVPRLGGQIYAMPGMSTQLHLIADKPGDYSGSSANISGLGFAGMTFTARASSQAAFDRWVKVADASPRQLNQQAYAQLAKPSLNNATTTYSFVPNDLYNDNVMKYMMPAANIPEINR